MRQIPADSLLFSTTRINNLHLSTCTQFYMQIEFCAKLDSLKCRAKLKSICLLVWKFQFLDQHQSKFYIHKLKFFESVKCNSKLKTNILITICYWSLFTHFSPLVMCLYYSLYISSYKILINCHLFHDFHLFFCYSTTFI